MTLNSKKILYAVLNWGLGHTSRSIPLIEELCEKNQVLLAAAGEASLMLGKQFPQLKVLPLPDYNINYGHGSMFVNAIIQYYSVNKAIRNEHKQVKKYVVDYQIDTIISDSVFGAYANGVPSFFLSHQLRLSVPVSLRLYSPMIQYYYQRYLRNFDEFWVPDYASEDNLSGALSHGVEMGTPLRYIGPLSRFDKLPESQSAKEYSYTFILSGPEPARSHFEKRLLNIIPELDGKVALVRGKFSEVQQQTPDNLVVYDFLGTQELKALIEQSEILLSRSGYSSLMDFHSLGRKAIIVPTPRQTEQEYLAEYHKSRGKFISIDEKDLTLNSLRHAAQQLKELV